MRYPSDLPPAARRRIVDALADATMAVIEAGPPRPDYQMFIVGGPPPPPAPLRPAAWDPAYVALTVLEVGVTVHSDLARTRKWTADKLHARVDDLRDQLLERSQGLDPATFDQRLNDCPWWLAFQRTLRDWRTTPIRTAPTFPKRATWLRAYIAKQRLSDHRFAILSEINHKTVKRILAGHRVQEETLQKLARALHCEVHEIPSS